LNKLTCKDSIESIWVLGTAGARVKISAKDSGVTKEAREKIDTAFRLALTTHFAKKKCHFEAMSGRFEGYFGFADAFKNHKDELGTKKMVYYEVGGMSS
jgi:hypothetical protein